MAWCEGSFKLEITTLRVYLHSTEAKSIWDGFLGYPTWYFQIEQRQRLKKKLTFAFAFVQCKRLNLFSATTSKAEEPFPTKNSKTENSNFSHHETHCQVFSELVVQKVKEVDPLRSGWPHLKTSAFYLSLIPRQYTYYCNPRVRGGSRNSEGEQPIIWLIFSENNTKKIGLRDPGRSINQRCFFVWINVVPPPTSPPPFPSPPPLADRMFPDFMKFSKKLDKIGLSPP